MSASQSKDVTDIENNEVEDVVFDNPNNQDKEAAVEDIQFAL